MREIVYAALAAILISGLSGCSNLPGSDQQQGAVIGGATGAAVGAAVSKEYRALGAVIGGAVGAAGGYVIGANKDKILGEDSEEAEKAARDSYESPVTPEQARNATTADVNEDGFVTLDELVAMERAGFPDDEIIRRLKATDHVFELTSEQCRYLLDNGVRQDVIDQLPKLNLRQRDEVTKSSGTKV